MGSSKITKDKSFKIFIKKPIVQCKRCQRPLINGVNKVANSRYCKGVCEKL